MLKSIDLGSLVSRTKIVSKMCCVLVFAHRQIWSQRAATDRPADVAEIITRDSGPVQVHPVDINWGMAPQREPIQRTPSMRSMDARLR